MEFKDMNIDAATPEEKEAFIEITGVAMTLFLKHGDKGLSVLNEFMGELNERGYMIKKAD